MPRKRKPSAPQVEGGEDRAPPDAALGSLDMHDENDRREVRRAVKKRWPVTDTYRRKAVRKLMVALEYAEQRRDGRAIRGIVRTLATLEGQNQIDEIKTKTIRMVGDELQVSDQAPQVQQTQVVNIGIQIDSGLRDRVARDPEAMQALLALRRRLVGSAHPAKADAGTGAAIDLVHANGHAVKSSGGLNGHSNGHRNGHAAE